MSPTGRTIIVGGVQKWSYHLPCKYKSDVIVRQGEENHGSLLQVKYESGLDDEAG
jgi:hypothetical protein